MNIYQAAERRLQSLVDHKGPSINSEELCLLLNLIKSAIAVVKIMGCAFRKINFKRATLPNKVRKKCWCSEQVQAILVWANL